ncbi:MAG: hypothetical protein MUO27_11900 [Sedimentisphaerales bacterium]|nr:hypothetical protein [Sedimentisphaerales bacterium]
MCCSVTRKLELIPGTRADYESLSHYHYREHHLGPYAAIFALKGSFQTAEKLKTVGVIVYSMPATGCQMRTIAAGNLFSGLDKSTRLKLINKNIRTISRVIIEPRFRSLGLAACLVKETMPIMDVPFIEALAVMGRISPFFEKAGMTRFDPPASVSCVRLTEALAAVGVDEPDLIDPRLVQQKLDKLKWPAADFIEHEMNKFLQGYGQRRLMQPDIDRTRFIASKLTDRPVYYLWRNPNLELRV